LLFCLYSENKLANVDTTLGYLFNLLIIYCVPSMQEQGNLAIAGELLHLFIVKAQSLTAFVGCIVFDWGNLTASDCCEK